MISLVMCARRKLRSIKRAWPGSSSTSRIVTDSSAGMRLSFCELVGNGEGKRRAHPERGVATNIAAMPPHEHLHIGQAHTFPWYVLPANTAKWLEDSRNILRGNATPVIADMQHGDVGTAFACHDDLARAAGGEISDRIRQKIPHDLFHSDAIGHHGGQRLHRDLHLTLHKLVCQSLYRLLRERLHVEWFEVEITAVQTRQVQDGSDEVI